MPPVSPGEPRRRYQIHDAFASGGMAQVHLGRMFGAAGFSRLVAIKRLRPGLATEPEFVAMLVDESRITSRIRHPNVVPTLDVVSEDGELLIVMEYIEGEALTRLLREASARPALAPSAALACAVAGDVLRGLHAAHEARGPGGTLLGVVHRDVGPQNILVGVDGIARLLDFGVARAMGRLQQTRAGTLKGKLPYMAPEQLRHEPATPRSDVYALAVTLWEMLACSRLFVGDERALTAKILAGNRVPPSELTPSLPRALDEVVLRGMAVDPDERYPTALAMAQAIEQAMAPASALEVARWVSELAGPALAERAALVARIESLPEDEPGPGDELPTERYVPPAARSSEPLATAPAAPLPLAVVPPEPAPSSDPNPPTLVALSTEPLLDVGGSERAPARLASPGLLLTAAGVVVAAGALGWMFGASTPPAANGVAAGPASAEPAAPTVSAVEPPVAASLAPSAAAAPPSSAPALRKAPARRVTPGCTPPYRYLPDGTKTFKPGCLR